MKTLESPAGEIKRVEEKNVPALIKKSWKYCSKSKWKEQHSPKKKPEEIATPPKKYAKKHRSSRKTVKSSE